MFFPLHKLEKVDLPLEIGGTRVRIFYENEAMTAWAEDEEGHLLPSVLAYDFGWQSFFPDGDTFQ